MPTWNSRGLRGSFLEELVNMTNEKYQMQDLALVQKIPTPIKPINIDQATRHITLAYFEQKSTVDYIGVVQGIPICFDAKECIEDRFPLSNVHEHQMKFMEQFESQDGIAFLLIYFKNREKYMYLRFQKLLEFWQRSRAAEKVLRSMRWNRSLRSRRIRGHFCIIWNRCREICSNVKIWK